jgi:hypothetical protein
VEQSVQHGAGDHGVVVEDLAPAGGVASPHRGKVSDAIGEVDLLSST